jgi:hypothetical protein
MRRGLLTLLAAFAFALAGMWVERVGRAPEAWRDELCSPMPLHPCAEGVLQGGWPAAFLIDKPGISVMGQLGLVEDRFQPWAFALDVGAIWLATYLLARLLGSRREGA